MNQCGTLVAKDGGKPEVEVIGDELKTMCLEKDPKQIKHLCILNVHPNYSIEAIHGNLPMTSGFGEEEELVPFYPHDAEQVLKELDQNIVVQIVNLTPNVRQSLATIRRLKHQVDIFINLYDNSDETAMRIVNYMQNQGLAFTGASAHFSDPTRIELKRLCRYSQLPTPKFALMTDMNIYDHDSLDQLSKALGGFPLFVKPEHGYDSKFSPFLR